MSEASPLSDLLAVLRERGLPIGVREHLTVGRLFERWENPDPASLRAALAAVLARSPEEVRLVRETFDELYGRPRANPETVRSPAGPRPLPRQRWGRIAGLLLASFLFASSLAKEKPQPVVVPHAPTPATHSATQPPAIFETFPKTDWSRALSVAAGGALLALLWLYGTRLQRHAGGLARRLWRCELDVLPRPYGYKLALDRLAPALPAGVLDQAARLLGRAPTSPRADDLDVDRSLDDTMRAGLAPQIVLRERSSPEVLLVLQDTASEMRPWRRAVQQLLDGLAARGVPLDVWRFHADANHVYRNPGRDGVSLARLAHLRAGSPLLVISTGEGAAIGRDGRLAAWVETLLAWDRRAWLHPVTDAAYWRPQLRKVSTDIWPLTPGGVLTAARHLAAVPSTLRARFPVFPDRPVVPLDVDRLRWLLSVTSQRDPDLVELLRQRFFPQIPSAALLEALDAPPLPQQPGSRPAPAEVHAFLADLLAASQPEPGSAAHARWLLDRAIHEIQVPARRERGLRQLQDLAAGPLAIEVEQAVGRLPDRQPRQLLKAIRKQAIEEGLAVVAGQGRWRWRWPDGFEWSLALLCGLLLAFGLGRWFVKQEPVELVTLYTLEVVDPPGPGPVYLRATRSAGAPTTAALYQQDRKWVDLRFGSTLDGMILKDGDRGKWYYLRAWMGSDRDRLAVSNSVLVNQKEPVRATTNSPEVSRPRPSKPPQIPEKTPEPMGTDLGPPAPNSADQATPRFGTLTADGEVRGAPTTPIASESAPSETSGKLTIIGYPDDLPSQLLHVVGPGTPNIGTPWSGGTLNLAPGDYLLVVHTQIASVPLTRVTIQAGATKQVDLPSDQLATVRRLLAEGPTIRQVTIDSLLPGLRRTTAVVSIQGSNFDPNAKVSFSPHTFGVAFQDCTPGAKEIRCPVSVESFAIERFPERLGGLVEVRVANPDGRSAVSELDLSSLFEAAF